MQSRVLCFAAATKQNRRLMPRHSVLDEITGRLLRPPFWLVKVLSQLPLFQLRRVLFYVETNDPVVALTLDDGPAHELTEHVLKTLKDHDAKATFFLLGEAASRNQDVIQAIADQGHELGNHTWLDEGSASLPEADLREKLRATHELLTRGDRPVRLFRPGGGWLGWRGNVVTIAKAQHGYRCVLGSVYPNDVRIRSDSIIVKDVLRRIRKGGIIILHEGEGKPCQPSRTRVVGILEAVLPELRRRGLSVVTVSELLAHERGSGS